MDREEIIDNFNHFLDDNASTTKLVLMALHIAMFELVNYVVVDNPKNFFGNPKLKNGKLFADDSEEYIRQVKDLAKKDRYKASAMWYLKHEIITQDEFEILIKFRNDRNEAAHEIVNILFDKNYSFDKGSFLQVGSIYKKISLWWLKDVHSTTHPEFDKIDRDQFDFESAIGPQMFPVNRLLELVEKILPEKK